MHLCCVCACPVIMISIGQSRKVNSHYWKTFIHLVSALNSCMYTCQLRYSNTVNAFHQTKATHHCSAVTRKNVEKCVGEWTVCPFLGSVFSLKDLNGGYVQKYLQKLLLFETLCIVCVLAECRECSGEWTFHCYHVKHQAVACLEEALAWNYDSLYSLHNVNTRHAMASKYKLETFGNLYAGILLQNGKVCCFDWIIYQIS